MDKEQEDMRFLGVYGIYAEACKIIFSWKKIFSQITLAFLFPATFILLAEIEISHNLTDKILHNEINLIYTQPNTPRYDKVAHLIYSEWATLILFKIAYLISFSILSLFYTSAIVYTIACAYTGRDITFRKVMTVVPKVWKRLMSTFFGIFCVMFAYIMVVSFALILYVILVGYPKRFNYVIFIVLALVFTVSLLYMSMIWYLANVVSVLEDACGFSAMKKSKELLKGKMLVTFFVLLMLNVLFYVVYVSFEKMAVSGGSLSVCGRVVYGILCFFLLAVLLLFGLVVQTVIYFVCKSYHHENIDKSALSDHLEVYNGDYVLLKARDVQLEKFDV